MSNPVTDFPWDPKHVDDTRQVATGQGVLHSIVVNGLTTAGDAIIYDSVGASARIIATLHLDPTTSISVQPITFLYDAAYHQGLYIEYDQNLVADLTVNVK